MNFGTLGQAQIPDLRKVLTLTAHVSFKSVPEEIPSTGSPADLYGAFIQLNEESYWSMMAHSPI